MPKSIQELNTLQSLDLSTFEIRGAKSGAGNAKTTGPVYVNGPYYISNNKLPGSATFVADSDIVSGITFDSPNASFTTAVLIINDTITVGTSSFVVTGIPTPDSVKIDKNSGLDGAQPVTYGFSGRDYLVQSDIFNNTSSGDATFTNGSNIVNGTATSWLSQIAANDSIKHNGYQNYFKISEVVNDTSLKLADTYTGDTTVGAYTAKKWYIGRTLVEYSKNDFDYDKNSGKWKENSISGTSNPTSTQFLALTDGIDLKYSHTVSPTAPDLMDSNTTILKTLAQKTQQDAFQFPLPVIPNPESTMELYLNGIKKDLFPAGNLDYIINYNQSPIYLPPPPRDKMQVASLMFLEAFSGDLDIQNTQTGQLHFVDSEGNPVSGIMPGSETINIDGTDQVLYEDYVIEPYSGTVEIANSYFDEKIVSYAAIDPREIFDSGFSVYLNGVRQKFSVPTDPSDDILFQPVTGRLKPQKQDHPGPNDDYRVNYMVECPPVRDEAVRSEATRVGPFGFPTVQTNFYPIKQNTLIVNKGGDILEEGTDYFVGYQTGSVFFVEDISDTVITMNYVPCAIQENSITYVDGVSYCTSYDSRLTVTDSYTLEFTILNTALDTSDLTILRVYNERADKDFDLTNIKHSGRMVRLDNTIQANIDIDLRSTDLVTIDYKFESEVVEYKPVIINTVNLFEGSSYFVIDGGLDVDNKFFNTGSVFQVTPPDYNNPLFFEVADKQILNPSPSQVYSRIVKINGTFPSDLVNPLFYVSDRPITFESLGTSSQAISTGASIVYVSGNVKGKIRKGCIISITSQYRLLFPGGVLGPLSENTDKFLVQDASYASGETAITIAGTFTKDFVSGLEISVSENPFYVEGSTEIIPKAPIVTLPNQPGLIFSDPAERGLSAVTDSTSLSIISDSSSYKFPFHDYLTLGDMSTAIPVHVSSLEVSSYVDDWDSTKIISEQSISISQSLTSTIDVAPALRLDGSDSTNFSITPAGTILLANPLLRDQTYSLDYMGRRYLGEKPVSVSASFFSTLPKGSKVQVSLQFDNQDQFYVQVLSQGDFLEQVTIPRMTEEANQLSGAAGQGGDVPGDEAGGNSEGGIPSDEFRRRDTEIECSAFETVYDWFSDRLDAFGTEMLNATGPRLFNNDGILTKDQQKMVTKSVNRIFPDADYTNFEPYRANPLTGEVTSYGANFTQGSVDVINVGENSGFPSYWTKQLVPGDFIRPYDSDIVYEIDSITDDENLVLTDSYTGPNPKTEKDLKYVFSSGYPLYDDDGNLGAKVVGERSGGFGLEDGDTFNVKTDGTAHSYTFTDPTNILNKLLYPLSKLSAKSAAAQISNPSKNFQATAEWVYDPQSTYGYRTVIVLRSINGANHLELFTGDAIEKLGFVENSEDYGNLEPLKNEPEISVTPDEGQKLGTEVPALNSLISVGSSNKIDRIYPWNTPYADIVYNNADLESQIIPIEQPLVDAQVNATALIVEEPDQPGYAQTLIAYNNALAMQQNTSDALSYDLDIVPGWQGKGDGTGWILDFISSDRYVRGKDGDIGVPEDTGPGIVSIGGETQFVIDAEAGNDRRILDAMINTTYTGPVARYEDTLAKIDGIWSGWDLSVDGSYSTNNQVTFNFNDTTAMFNIRPDGVPANPSYITNGTGLTINWTKAEGNVNKTFSYSGYPNLEDLMNRISQEDGWGVSTSHNPDYDYTGFSFAGPSAVGSAPGVPIYAGVSSPAFQMYYTPTYTADNDKLVLIDTEFLYSGYPTLGALTSAIGTMAGFTTENIFAPEYEYEYFRNASGDVSSSSPGTSLYFSQDTAGFGIKFNLSDPQYSVDAIAVGLSWKDLETNTSESFPFFAHSTIGSLISDLNAKKGFMALGLHEDSYNYTNLNVESLTSIPLPSQSPVTISTGSGSKAFTIRYTGAGTGTGSYVSTPTYFRIISSVYGTTTFLYSTYSTLSSLEAAINVVFAGSTTINFELSYTSTNLKIGSGAISAVGTPIYFETPVPLINLWFQALGPYYTVGSSDIVLSYTDGTSLSTKTTTFASRPTLSSMINEIKSESGFDASAVYNSGAYFYENLKTTTAPVSIAPDSYTPVNLGSRSAAMKVVMYQPPFLVSDNTATALITPQGTSYTKLELLYTNYPTLGDLESELDSVNRFNTTSLFDPDYEYGHLQITTSNISTTPPGSAVFFDTIGAPVVLFSLFWDMKNVRYDIDRTSINILWDEDTTPAEPLSAIRTFRYTDYPVIGNIAAGIQQITGIDVQGNIGHDSSNSNSLKLASGSISPDASVFPALRPAYVTYNSISDKMLDDRLEFVTDRSGLLTDRNNYLIGTRESQIKSHVVAEGILRDSDGNPGDLYAWANNRWNRRQGCEARLAGAEKLIEANNSALQINKMMMS